MQLQCFNCLSAHTIYWVGPIPQPSKQFFSIYWFLQCIIYNIDLFNFSFAFLRTVIWF